MRIGFTGTQKGMTALQKRSFEYAIKTIFNIEEFHHGDCVGSDKEAHDTIRNLLPKCEIHGHPPKNPSKRAFCECDVLHEEKEYLERNKDIVDAVDILIATPKEDSMITRSGTWSTVRYAHKKLVTRIMVLPNGDIL